MVKTTVRVDGMMCGMCEAHVADAIRNAFPGARKVKASRKKGIATFVTEDEIDEEALKKAIEQTGYIYVNTIST